MASERGLKLCRYFQQIDGRTERAFTFFRFSRMQDMLNYFQKREKDLFGREAEFGNNQNSRMILILIPLSIKGDYTICDFDFADYRPFEELFSTPKKFPSTRKPEVK